MPPKPAADVVDEVVDPTPEVIPEVPALTRTQLESAKQDLLTEKARIERELVVLQVDLDAMLNAERPVADPTTHVLVDFTGSGDYVIRNQPAAFNRDRVLLLDSMFVEHVAEDANGVWCYRRL